MVHRGAHHQKALTVVAAKLAKRFWAVMALQYALGRLPDVPVMLGGAGTPDALSAVKHRPADVVPQPLVVKYELANRVWELVTLPPALESPCALALAFRRASTCGLDRIGRCAELVRGDMCDHRSLASSVRGVPCCATQVSGRAHRMAARRAGLGHGDLATHPGADMLDRLTRSRVLRLSRLEARLRSCWVLTRRRASIQSLPA